MESTEPQGGERHGRFAVAQRALGFQNPYLLFLSIPRRERSSVCTFLHVGPTDRGR